jgi:hypothetical protein
MNELSLLVAAMLAQPECAASEAKINRVAQQVIVSAHKHGIPTMLLAAVILAESGGRKIVTRHKYGCDVGEGQIFVPACDRLRMQRLLVLSVNVDRGADLLGESQKRCMARKIRPCLRSKWALYNAGSRGWWPRVKRIWGRMMRYGDT